MRLWSVVGLRRMSYLRKETCGWVRFGDLSRLCWGVSVGVHGHGEVGEGIRRAAAALVGSVGCVGASLAGVEATVVSF